MCAACLFPRVVTWNSFTDATFCLFSPFSARNAPVVLLEQRTRHFSGIALILHVCGENEWNLTLCLCYSVYSCQMPAFHARECKMNVGALECSFSASHMKMTVESLHLRTRTQNGVNLGRCNDYSHVSAATVREATSCKFWADFSEISSISTI